MLPWHYQNKRVLGLRQVILRGAKDKSDETGQ